MSLDRLTTQEINRFCYFTRMYDVRYLSSPGRFFRCIYRSTPEHIAPARFVPVSLLGLVTLFLQDVEEVPSKEAVDRLMVAKWRYSQTYTIASATEVEERQPVW